MLGRGRRRRRAARCRSPGRARARRWPRSWLRSCSAPVGRRRRALVPCRAVVARWPRYPGRTGPELSLIVLARYSCKMRNSGSSELRKAAQAIATGKTVSIYTRCPPVQSAGPSAGVVALIAQAVLLKDGVPSPLVEEYEVTMDDADQLISNGALDRRDYIETTIDKNQKSTTWKIFVNGTLHKSGAIAGASHEDALKTAQADALSNLPGRCFPHRAEVQLA